MAKDGAKGQISQVETSRWPGCGSAKCGVWLEQGRALAFVQGLSKVGVGHCACGWCVGAGGRHMRGWQASECVACVQALVDSVCTTGRAARVWPVCEC